MYQVLYHSEDGTYAIDDQFAISPVPASGFDTLEEARFAREQFLSGKGPEIVADACLILDVGSNNSDSLFPTEGTHDYRIITDSESVQATLRVYRGFHYHVAWNDVTTDVSPLVDAMQPQAHFCTVYNDETGKWFAFNWKNVCFNFHDRPLQIASSNEKVIASAMLRRSFPFALQDIQFTSKGVSFTPFSQKGLQLTEVIGGTRSEVTIYELTLTTCNGTCVNYIIDAPSSDVILRAKRVYKDTYWAEESVPRRDADWWNPALHFLTWDSLCRSYLTHDGSEPSEQENDSFLSLVVHNMRRWLEFGNSFGFSVPCIFSQDSSDESQPTATGTITPLFGHGDKHRHS